MRTEGAGDVVFRALRRLDFRGKGRLRPFLPVPTSGRRLVRYPDGLLLRLDLAERHQQDIFFGLHERLELAITGSLLAAGGDAVDVGAHIGMFSITAALTSASFGGRVLALEPNPRARAQLEENIRLNGCTNVRVSAKAASDAARIARLYVPTTPDPSWSSLEERSFEPGAPLPVETTTIDAEVETHGLRPVFVKIDVEGHELAVLDGTRRTLEQHRPVVLCEVSDATASSVAAFLAGLGYAPVRVRPRRLEPGLGPLAGIFNVFFVPNDRPLGACGLGGAWGAA